MTSRLAPCFSAARGDWETPRWIIERYGPFDLDVAASPENAKAPRFYTVEQDGLQQPWEGRCWCNPPYGRGVGDWIAKAVKESREHGARTTLLLPSRTDTRWWHDYVEGFGLRYEFLRGRVKFEGAAAGAPFPSVLIFVGA